MNEWRLHLKQGVPVAPLNGPPSNKIKIKKILTIKIKLRCNGTFHLNKWRIPGSLQHLPYHLQHLHVKRDDTMAINFHLRESKTSKEKVNKLLISKDNLSFILLLAFLM